MRLERLSVNQFKIFLTYNDLKERGYSKEELWNNLPKANELFQDMLYEACDELGIELDGKLVVQVYMLQAQGMVIVVTQNNEGMSNEDFIELKVTMDESKELMSFKPLVHLRSLLNVKHLCIIMKAIISSKYMMKN